MPIEVQETCGISWSKLKHCVAIKPFSIPENETGRQINYTELLSKQPLGSHV